MVHALFCAIVAALFYAGVLSLQAANFRLGGRPEIMMRLLFFVGCLYTGRWIFQQWYLRNRIIPFILLSLLSFFAVAVAWWLVTRFVLGHPYAGFLEVIFSVMPFFTIGIVLGMLLKLIRATVQKQVREAAAAAEQKQSELSLLQSQLSPHFLFNTLNNLYGLSITRPERLPALLLKLSDLLRYSVYDTKKTFVPLAEELAYIQNYLDFEKIRISDRLLLKTDIPSVADSRLLVAPMIFIVFIENAFKHAKNTLDQKIYIDISLTLPGDGILFSVRNSTGGARDTGNVLNEHSGLGLANTIKRLDLLYGSDYALQQSAGKDVYTIELKLKIKRS